MAWGIFSAIRKGLSKTRAALSGALHTVLTVGRKVDEELLEELEDALIAADVGPRLAAEIVDDLRAKHKAGAIKDAGEILESIRADMVAHLTSKDIALRTAPTGPTVILMVGVNGTGKTTTTAKLAQRFRTAGKRVLLAAADTFRAAAGEQLDIWAQRLEVEIVRHPDGADPAAVVFDACEAACARSIDVLIIDTAGRLHTKDNLMRELEKIRRVAEKKIEGAPHEALLVLDATTGQNALSQASLFAEGVGLTGLVLAKLDGTAKGGIGIAINRAVDLPIKLVGVGEKEDDLVDFDPIAYVDAMFEIETDEAAEARHPEDDAPPEAAETQPAPESEPPAAVEPADAEAAGEDAPPPDDDEAPAGQKRKKGWFW